MTYAGGPATAPGKALPVLNLCFHGVGEPQRPLEPDEHLYWVTEERFEELLGVAADHPNVHVTFDDGNASDLTIALQALQRHGTDRRVLRPGGTVGCTRIPVEGGREGAGGGGGGSAHMGCTTGPGHRSDRPIWEGCAPHQRSWLT